LERKLRAERQARLHHEELSTEAVSSSVPAKAKEGKGKVEEGVTMISVRFPDSIVLKGRFESGKTLKDVRSWIDETRNMSTAPPYVFQTTFPTRTFEVSEEEHETLSSLFGKGGQVVLKVHPYSRVVWLM
jgi:UBX domain